MGSQGSVRGQRRPAKLITAIPARNAVGPCTSRAEDFSQILDMITAQLKLVEVARQKVLPVLREDGASPAPPRQPCRSEPARLHPRRQTRRSSYALSPERNFARMEAYIPDATLPGWCGGTTRTLAPQVELNRKDGLACDLLHGLRHAHSCAQPREEGRMWA